MKLARKLTLALMLGMAAIFAAYGWLNVRRQVASFQADMLRDQRSIGRALSAAVGEVWRADGEERALDLVEYANAREGKVRVRWVWLDDLGGTHEPEIPARDLRPLEDGREVSRLDWGASGHLYSYVPVVLEGARTGALELSESIAPEYAFLRMSLLHTVGTIGVMAAVSGLLAMGLGVTLVGRPVGRLVAQMRRVGAGDLGQRLKPTASDEIAEVARETDAMCDRLVEARDRVERETAARIAALQQLRHADRLATVGKLASGVAHELGTPLNVVSGRAKMIAQGEVSGSEIEDNARIVAEQADRMARIVRQLLDFARQRSPRRAPADLRAILDRIATLLGPMAEARRVRIRVQGGEPATTPVDADQVQQAVTNLVLNAIQATPVRGGIVSVDLSQERARPPADLGRGDTACWRIDVRDEGTGISDDALPHVFEPFFTTKDVGEGTGLGLSVAYGIVREHGGWISVQSAPGQGSRFSVYLPEEGAEEGAWKVAS